MTLKGTDSLGENISSQFNCCDVVAWKDLGQETNIGIIYDLYTVQMGGREIKKAKVCSFRDSLDYDVLLVGLKLVSKAR
tara:strand:+ start:64 stop:300 length:237 start_codon:yes stop_codon:yes gene_type:complete